MSARWIVHLRQTPKGWEWAREPNALGHTRWWGFYKTEGAARGAAKRAIPSVVGGKTDPADFEFRNVTKGV